jgi:hypothetical protein
MEAMAREDGDKFHQKTQEKKKSSGILSGTVVWAQKINS